jgi:uncharacterized 2Fe-2S/4Fe-4S cluster protein (DUF4445 family)
VPGKPPPSDDRRATLFDRADELSLRVPTSCGRSGRCRECVVEVHEGAEYLAERTEPEGFLRGDFRLACKAQLTEPDAPVAFDVVRRRLRIVAGEDGPREGPLRPMSNVRDGVVHWGDEPVAPLRESGRILGLAIDVGTTTVAFELLDLSDGSVIELVTLENPQRFGGSDVMSRISYDRDHPGEMRYALRKAINDELLHLYRRHGFDRRDVYEAVLVGNSTMREMIFGIDVQSIGQKPYKSTVERELLEGKRSTTELVAKGHELGLWVHPQARIWGAPLIASHLGADVTADIVATGLIDRPGISMLVDVGTNSEVVLVGHGRVLAASCPAGPAFEGGEVTYGMQASEGAIESIEAVDGELRYETIGGAEPIGICGSGLVDLLAELRRTDRMTPKGVFADKAKVVEVVPDAGITLSRADASALAQAKAANTVGQQILLRELGVAPADVDRLFIAGGFARYLDIENAIAIGFLAPVHADRVEKVGNASLRGARELLLDVEARVAAEQALASIEHLELETTPDFFELFVDAVQFKPIGATNNPRRAAA